MTSKGKLPFDISVEEPLAWQFRIWGLLNERAPIVGTCASIGAGRFVGIARIF
jgi:hypothetical protein